MLAPVNRCQSPISTASANPVSVAMPRRHASRRVTAVNSLSPASAVIFSSSRARRAVVSTTVSYASSNAARVGGESNRCWRSHRSCSPVHALPPEYTIPCRSSSFDTRCRARIRSCREASRARTRSRAAPPPGPGPAPALIRPQQPGQIHRVTRIGLHPIPRRTMQLRRRRHLAPQPRPRQQPRQPEPGGPGLIHDSAWARQPADPLEHLRMRRRQPRLEQLTGLPVNRRRSNRPCMHIQPNTRTLRKHRGLLTPVGKAEHQNALGNPRDCVSEVPASNPPNPASSYYIRSKGRSGTSRWQATSGQRSSPECLPAWCHKRRGRVVLCCADSSGCRRGATPPRTRGVYSDTHY